MSTQRYLLIRRTPDRVIKARTLTFTGVRAAAGAAGQILHDNAGVWEGDAQKFAAALTAQPVGVIWGHPSGYDFRILPAHFTADGIAITPGLRVITNDLKWGTVEVDQFMNEADPFGPGGQHADGWYHLNHEDGTRYARFNGERLGTVRPRGLR